MMNVKSVFNATVCIVGIILLIVHIINLAIRKNRRKDENALLIFFIFTALHFATYLVFTLIKISYTSDAYVMSFYTTFYIMNNIEACLLLFYMLNYVLLSDKIKRYITSINAILFLAFIIFDIINIFTHTFFYAEGGEYIRNSGMIISQIYQFLVFATIFLTAIINKKLRIMEKIAFSTYCVLPLVAIILQNVFPGYAIAYFGIIISIEVLFLFLSQEKNLQLSYEQQKNKDAQIKIMMSQIRPHFVYNTLSSISTMIPIDPSKAEKALDEFTEYLRANFSSLTSTRLIPFMDELKHIKTYLSLEQMRFGDRVKAIFDIDVSDFDVPPLSIQPIVENSIKHGILQKIEGGTVNIKTYEEDDSYIVIISDNGVGFNTEDLNLKDNKHIGLANVTARISSMCDGKIDIESKINEGTTVKVTFYK